MAYIQFNAKEVLEKAPKTKELLKEYMLKNISEGVPEEFKKQMKEYISKDDTLYTMVGMNPRMMLYDFFDENKLYINIQGEELVWTSSIRGFINNEGVFYNSQDSNSRKEAEIELWKMAIKIMESISK